MSLEIEDLIPKLLMAAWLLPLVGFLVEIFAPLCWQRDRKDKRPAGFAVFCIGTAFVLSLTAFVLWGNHTEWSALSAHGHGEHVTHDDHEHEQKTEPANKGIYSGLMYTLGSFGDLTIGLEYYIDSLTLAMFVMVTLIATCIHVFAMGYMSDELTDDHVDHQVHPSKGGHFHRPGRYSLFFAYMSLFSFSMLGIVIAGNLFQVFIFWELVGVTSYLLIGFYVERHTASTAANKAFIMNRVGDFGFLIGMMVIWTYFGTFSFAGFTTADENGPKAAGLFSMLRDDHGHVEMETTESGESIVHLHSGDSPGEDESTESATAEAEAPRTIPYWLLVAAGVGVFAGCVGKSAQFPLQTWLPDAMEGPTPVSALVHSATMVAAGVYLTARFTPMFLPEVLLVIAYTGCITLFLGATIALVATDIKRVLAYSTISQLGYMMLVLGVAGWGAGLFHLFTHAFFKSLMFLCAGSVIVGCHHEQEMTRMGGLLKKMPITALTMLVGVIAICGLAIPGLRIAGEPIAFSGYHSKDAILATALAFWQLNPVHLLLFFVPLATAGITAFYMFRLWFYTFWGEPRDQHLYDHAHESPKLMTGPLIVLAIFAVICGVGGEGGPLFLTIVGSEPAGVAEGQAAAGLIGLALPGHSNVAAVHSQAGTWALLVAFGGAILAYLVYGAKLVDPRDIKQQFTGLHGFLIEKWQFDTLYDVMVVRPVHQVARWMTTFDRVVLDGFLHWVASFSVKIARWDRWFDERAVDGMVNVLGDTTYATGRMLRQVQTGYLRQYVLFIFVGVGLLAIVVPIIAMMFTS